MINGYLHRIDTNTSIKFEIPMRVLTLERELGKKDFPMDFFERVLRRFALDRDKI